MSSDRTLDVNLGVDEHDELDRKIDRALGRIGVLVRTLFVIAALVFIGLFVVYPQWDVMGPFITTGLYLVFQLFYVAFLMIFQFIVLFWFIGRPRIYWLMPGETGVGFKDYKGNPEVLESARQVVTLLKGVKRFKLMGGQPIRGLLLEGPPGTGKSYLGQAIATEAQLPFGYMSAPSIQGMFWGMDTLRVLSLYNKARKLARKHGACILFIDEIDAIGKSRSGVGNAGGFGGMMMGGGGGALNELLNQMDPLPKDGFKDKILRMFGMRKGKADQPPVLTIADKRRLAYHEAGHAVAAVKLLKRHRVARATIEARHDIGAAALVAWKPLEEIHTKTKDELLADMQISLASRACEQIFLGTGEEMTGASGDLAHATQVAEAMIKLYGMNGSLMSYGGMMGAGSPFGPMGGGGGREVDRLLDQNFKRVKMLLDEHRSAVVAVAEALIEKHALMGDEIYELVARAESRTNGHANGHAPVPPPDAPAFEITAGGQQRVDPN